MTEISAKVVSISQIGGKYFVAVLPERGVYRTTIDGLGIGETANCRLAHYEAGPFLSARSVFG
jgi:hypothetical protein